MYYTMWYLLRCITSSPRRRKKKIRRKFLRSSSSPLWGEGKHFESIIPILLALVLYLNSLKGDFVHDDVPAIVKNPDVNGGNTFWIRIFKNDFWGSSIEHPLSHKSYRPLTILIFRFCYWFGEGSPWPFHVVNIFLHLSSTHWLSIICASVLHLKSGTQFVIVTLFALHPIHTEAVSGIVGCADLLSANFLLISFIAYTRSSTTNVPEEKIFWRALSLISAIMSLLSKETGISTLVINLMFTLFHEASIKSPSISPKRIPIDIFSFVCLLVSRLAIQKQSLPEFSEPDNPAAFHPDSTTRLYTFFYLPVHNFWLLMCPSYLSYDWQMGTIPLIKSIFDFRNIISIIFYGGITKLILLSTVQENEIGKIGIKANKNNRPVFTGMLFLILPFLPATNLFFPVGFVIAERILYLPSIGFSILIGIGFERVYSVLKRFSFPKYLLQFSLILLCFCFASKTVRRNNDWTSRESLFKSGLINSPRNAKVHYNFANLKRESGEIRSAVYYYKEALRLWPRYVPAHNNLATILSDKKQVEYHLRQALKANPGHPNSLYNLAALLRNEDNCEGAIPLLERCIEANHYDQVAYTLLFDCLRETKRIDSGLIYERPNRSRTSHDDYSGHVKLRQDLVPKDATRSVSTEQNVDFLSQMAEIYISLTKYTKAATALYWILDMDPFHKLSLYQLSQVYLEQNRKEEALQIIDRADHLCFFGQDLCIDTYCQKLCTRILIQKGDVYRSNRAYKDAIKHYTLALERSPSEPSLLLSLGALHHALEEWDAAWKCYRECLQLDPHNTDLHSNMEKLLRAQNMSEERHNSTFN